MQPPQYEKVVRFHTFVILAALAEGGFSRNIQRVSALFSQLLPLFWLRVPGSATQN